MAAAGPWGWLRDLYGDGIRPALRPHRAQPRTEIHCLDLGIQALLEIYTGMKSEDADSEHNIVTAHAPGQHMLPSPGPGPDSKCSKTGKTVKV